MKSELKIWKCLQIMVCFRRKIRQTEVCCLSSAFTDTRMAGRTDDLTASIHYGEVSAFITEFLQKNTYQLLERAAEELAEALLLEWTEQKNIYRDQETMGACKTSVKNSQREDRAWLAHSIHCVRI